MARLLIVDGNALAHESWHDLFEGHGYEVTAYDNGFEALAAGQADAPDVVLMDMEGMPTVGQGMLLVENFRAELPDTPILVVVGGPLSLICESIRELGADVCVSRPLDYAALVKMVDIMLAHLRPRVHTKARTYHRGERQLVH